MSAESRFGPTLPFVPARRRTWHEPHFFAKSCLPATTLALSLLPVFVQPEASRAAATSARTATERDIREIVTLCMRARCYPEVRITGRLAGATREGGAPCHARHR